MFQPIDKMGEAFPSRYYEVIIRNINDMINKGVLKRGDKLPSERELAEQFNISRVPVREALKILEFLGIVCKIPGEGMYIRDIEIATLLNKIFLTFQLDENSVIELYEVRILLETYAARQAALVGTDEALDEIQRSVSRMKSTLQSCAEGANDLLTMASHDFHNAIFKASKNEILYELYKFLFTLLDLSYKRTHSRPRYSQSSLEYHTRISELIRARDADAAAATMQEHLSIVLEGLKATQPGREAPRP